jgi:hypothetical protein
LSSGAAASTTATLSFAYRCIIHLSRRPPSQERKKREEKKSKEKAKGEEKKHSLFFLFFLPLHPPIKQNLILMIAITEPLQLFCSHCYSTKMEKNKTITQERKNTIEIGYRVSPNSLPVVVVVVVAVPDLMLNLFF